MIEVISNRLKGRSAVITGGASGIGLATARRFAAEGAHVVIADLDPTSGQRAADEVGGLYVKVDVTSEEEVKNLYAVTNETYGSVDISFNNAGISPRTTPQSSTQALTPGAGSRK